MSILDINAKCKKMVIIYLIFSLFCLIFSIIYLKFSYGVVSYFMKYLSLIPFVLGAVIYYILGKIKYIEFNKLSHNLYNFAIITLTVGSTIQGILEICGAASKYIIVYLVIGIVFILISVINLIVQNIKAKN